MRILGGAWVNGESSCGNGGCGLPPSALPGISPSRGEIGKRGAPRKFSPSKMIDTSPRFDLPP
ncbi:hypothetical protein CFBP6624_01560 [Agrobacterium tumefaciens]|uniref:Propionyl-coenzyme A carboxylase alpha polypeptide n=1 Tax=Agrobacterium tumefaciens TaxID=358 RepID=A0AAE6BK23_AGRTU|nr:hypothetical protein CFBP6624_01560 [Agrobacterium tumefaciens]